MKIMSQSNGNLTNMINSDELNNTNNSNLT